MICSITILQWRHKGAIASQITGNRLFVGTLLETTNKENFNPHCWPIVMVEWFDYHYFWIRFDVIMSSWFINSTPRLFGYHFVTYKTRWNKSKISLDTQFCTHQSGIFSISNNIFRYKGCHWKDRTVSRLSYPSTWSFVPATACL